MCVVIVVVDVTIPYHSTLSKIIFYVETKPVFKTLIFTYILLQATLLIKICSAHNHLKL